jgi:hypothetical protein
MESNFQIPAAPQVRFGEWISEGWRMFTEQWQSWVLLGLGFFGVIAVPLTIFLIYIYGIWLPQSMSGTNRPGATPPDVWPIFLGYFLLILLMMPLAAFLSGGMFRAAFKQLRGGKVEFKDLFSAGDCFLRLLGAAALMWLAIVIGSMLCIIPGYIAYGLLFFTFPLIVHRNMGVIEAMKLSIATTKPNLLMFTLFGFVHQLIGSAGTYACYVGLLATIPLMYAIHAVAYRDCFGIEGARTFAPQLPPPSIYAPPPQMAQAPPPAPAYVCPNCQTSLPPTAAFCPKCGAGVRR